MTLSIVALSGSLRAGSFNTAQLRAAALVAPEGVEITLHDYSDLPLFNGDLDLPPAVTRLREVLGAADALLISTPEYNNSIPGVLKNAIDWASRPAFLSCLAALPSGLLSATGGSGGGMLAQAHLRTTLASTRTPVYAGGTHLVGSAFRKFGDGELTDEPTRDHLRSWLEGFVDWARRAPRL